MNLLISNSYTSTSFNEFLPVNRKYSLFACSNIIVLQEDNSVGVLNDGTGVTGKEIFNRVLVGYTDLLGMVRVHSKKEFINKKVEGLY